MFGGDKAVVANERGVEFGREKMGVDEIKNTLKVGQPFFAWLRFVIVVFENEQVEYGVQRLQRHDFLQRWIVAMNDALHKQ